MSVSHADEDVQNEPTVPEDFFTDLPANDDIPEETEDMTVSDEAGHTFASPSRIAARFYRPTAVRRKSSAASSRRNSLSSTQSLQSNSSYAQARRSNHVAQYLRRASIIQSRKDRLAAREAHAEQVRLRAALAKAAPRSSNSEERALAAEKARQERLAQIAASCAEEVRRSKKVAEENKAKKAAEEERLRLEAEQRHAEAERRRQELRKNPRRPRNTSTPDVKKLVIKTVRTIDEDTAARRIQSAWRTSRRKRVLETFFELGLSIDKVHDTTFEEVRERLNDEQVLVITTALLKLLSLHPADEKELASQMFTRTFLSAYMILGHPAEVLSADGDQEKDVIGKAKELIISFEDVLSKCTRSSHYMPPAMPLESLRWVHSTYCTAFADWKAKDATIMIETLVNSFVSLESIWQSVKDDNDGGVSNDYRDGIRESQVIVLNKIHKLAGRDRGMALVRKALREHRRNYRRRKPVGDFRPRGAAAESIHHAPIRGGGSGGSSGDAPAGITQEQDQTPTPGSVAEALNKLFSAFPPNRVLTHELALNKNYRVDISPHSQLNDELNREICNEMRKAFQNGEGAVWTVAMAENIRTKLLHLVKAPKHPLQPVISETLDSDHISREVQQGVFSYPRFFNFMATILPKLCAPFRDDQVKALAQDLRQEGGIDEMIEKLFRLLHVIDLLCLDYSNFLLTTVAPTLIKESQGYEHRMFAQDLQNGVHTLEKTKNWWRNASVNICTESNRQDPGTKPSVQKIYARGLTDLAVAAGQLRGFEVPETLHLDFDRLKEIRTRAVRITVIGAILITAKNLLKRDVRHQWKAEANRMWEILKSGFGSAEDDSVAAKVLSVIESSHALPPATKIQLQGTIVRLFSQAQAGKLTDPVVKVLSQRLKTHIFHRLSASSSGERVRVATTAGEGLATSGLPEFVGQVGDIVDLLTRVSEVDRKSHGMWYEQVAKEVEAMGEEDE